MTRIEKMPPDTWLQELEEWRTEAEKTLRLLKKELNRKSKEAPLQNGAIAQKIYGGFSHGKVQFYHMEKIGGKFFRKYIPRGEMGTVQDQLQQEYYQGLITQFEKNINLIDSFLKEYKAVRVNTYFSSLAKPKQKIITPILLTNELFAQKWQSEEYEHKDFSALTPEHYTAKNERVRSKSEVIIADTLTQRNIPYKYECALHLGNLTLHPDFLCLNVRTHHEFFWEHLGLMDQQTYSLKALARLELFMNHGYFLGKEIIISWETAEKPFTKTDALRIIEKYLQ